MKPRCGGRSARSFAFTAILMTFPRGGSKFRGGMVDLGWIKLTSMGEGLRFLSRDDTG